MSYELQNTEYHEFCEKNRCNGLVTRLKRLEVGGNKNKIHGLSMFQTGSNECDSCVGYDILSTMNDDIMENIMIYLDSKDLLSLSETSSRIEERVQTYALHYVLSYSRMDKMNSFLNSDPELSEISMIYKCLELYTQLMKRRKELERKKEVRCEFVQIIK